MRDVVERFSKKFTRRDPDQCWPWNAALNEHGYGVFAWVEDRLAHRAAYRLFVGPIAAGAVVRHTCDNPRCVNPKHLVSGTQADNMADAVERDRISFGESHGQVKLSEAEARFIVESDELAEDLATRFSVHPDLVRMIQRGVRWRRLEVENIPERTRLRREYGGRGPGHHATHLTIPDVIAIRRDRRTHREIAEAFGIGQTTVSNIKNYKQWGHIPPSADDYQAGRPAKVDHAPCSVDGCGGNAAKGAKGLCRAHYHRFWRYGDATHSPRNTVKG